MINEVFLIGQVMKLTAHEDKGALDLQVQTKRYYGVGDNTEASINTHNVYLVGSTEATRKFIEANAQSKRPTYIGVYGMLSERSLPAKEGEEYGPKQNYIFATKVMQLSNAIESSEARAFFQGEVVWRGTSFTKNNKPRTRLIMRQARRTKRDDGKASFIGVPVTVYKDAMDVPFAKGDTAMFAGQLESYELEDYPGVFTSSITSFDYLGAATYATEDGDQSTYHQAPDISMSSVTETHNLEELDFAADESLPF